MRFETTQYEAADQQNGSGLQPGLRTSNFRQVSLNGFGDPLNAYPHAMMWFKNRLYVGTTRANLHSLYFARSDRHKTFTAWPVQNLKTPYDHDLRAQIWRYNPVIPQWEKVFVSAMVMGSEGFEIPLAIGFRGMTIHQGLKDPSPALYFPTWSSRLGPGPVLLRSFDGTKFEEVSEPGLGDPTVTTIRSIVSFKGKLFVAPTGTTKDRYSGSVPDRLVVFVCRDPERSKWELACEPFFGDKTNLGVFCMAVYNGYLYAGTANAEEGFQIWKTDAEGNPPYHWTKVLSRGGYRGKENEGVVSMTEFRGKLYVGTGILGGYDRERNVGPASPELFRLGPDDSWELLVGESRTTPEGLKVPMSGLGAGFNIPTVGYFWSLCEHEGWLYLGTYNLTSWLPFIHARNWPLSLRQLVEHYGLENIMEIAAGFDLWRSPDGARWLPVNLKGFGNPCNYGVRTMASSPFGLFVGAANPFAPTMAVKRLAGWKYVPNPRGGLEIWLGKTNWNENEKVGQVDKQTALGSEGRNDSQDPAAFSERLVEVYYQESGFRNCGMWKSGAKNPVEACENLMDEMISFFPEGKKRILEIGCRQGATTLAILKRLSGISLTGVVRTKVEWRACRNHIPEAEWHRMKGPRLRFKGDSFDCVISVEGLKAFGKADKLFLEILRVLKPGGKLLFSDLIYDLDTRPKKPRTVLRNMADSPEELRMLLVASGFKQVRMYDMTELCWNRFQKHFSKMLALMSLANEITEDQRNHVLLRLPNHNLPVSYYAICSATKGNGREDAGKDEGRDDQHHI